MIGEHYLDAQKDVYVCFIDYEKAFDRVNHQKVIECLQEIGIDGKDLRIIPNLYWSHTAAVRTDTGLTSDFQIKRGVRQGCILSPSLFNLYTEKILKEISDVKVIVIGGRSLNNLRYADDTALLAETQEQLQHIINLINDKGMEYEMAINIKKTKTMIISRKEKNDIYLMAIKLFRP